MKMRYQVLTPLGTVYSEWKEFSDEELKNIVTAFRGEMIFSLTFKDSMGNNVVVMSDILKNSIVTMEHYLEDYDDHLSYSAGDF